MGAPAIPLHLTDDELARLTFGLSEEEEPGEEPDVVILLDGKPLAEQPE